MNRTIMWATALTMVFLFSTACELGIEVSTPIPQTPDDVELSVLIVPPDRGYVEIDGSIITSGIAVPINHGKLVNLVAKPIDTDWQFARWERDMSGTSPGETLVMDESKVVRAVFAVPTPLPAAPVSITPEYREDFEDGLAQGWQSEAGWSVVQDGNNNVFQGRNHSWTTFTQGHAWNDYVLRFRVKL
ncbi:MAG: hypothetical protein QF898_08310, partial [SAR202 cluster bacterium]|nr:hypothetical protein [SAR202 cluster bacterium]